jgi:hypothetical protein
LNSALGIGAEQPELERTVKMEHENESENGHFCKIEGYARFFKIDHFLVHFGLLFKFIFENKIENRSKMSQKWPKNCNREQPVPNYYSVTAIKEL